jgi:hypothetical protein
MSQPIPPPPNQPPEWTRPRWFSAYFILFSIAVTLFFLQAAVPARWYDRGPGDGMLKALALVPVSFVLDILAAVGVAIAVKRSRLTSGGTIYHTLVALALFLLGTVAAGIFVFVSCAAVSNY